MGRNNNAFAAQRDAEIYRFIEIYKIVTAWLLTFVALFPNETRGQRRLKRLSERKKLKCIGYVESGGRHRKAYTRGYVAKPQHEYEIAEIAVRLMVDQLLEDDSDLRIDRLIRVNGVEYGWEHDRGTESIVQVKGKQRKFESYPHDLVWTVPNEQRRDALLLTAPNDTQWFALTADALTDPHGDIFINRQGEQACLPAATR